jgi:hypothetical protein
MVTIAVNEKGVVTPIFHLAETTVVCQRGMNQAERNPGFWQADAVGAGIVMPPVLLRAGCKGSQKAPGKRRLSCASWVDLRVLPRRHLRLWWHLLRRVLYFHSLWRLLGVDTVITAGLLSCPRLHLSSDFVGRLLLGLLRGKLLLTSLLHRRV